MPTPSPPWDRLFNDIKIAIPGATDAVLKQELWRATEDFLYETNAWIEEVPFTLTPNVLTYTVTPAGKGSFERLMMVYDPKASSPDKRWAQPGIQFFPPDKITITYSPSSGTEWVAVFAMNISDPPSDEGYPEFDPGAAWIVDRYRDVLRYCTLAYLMLQPSKPYSNAKLGAINWQSYVNMRGKARAEILHSNVYNGQRWMFPQAYATTARKGWM